MTRSRSRKAGLHKAHSTGTPDGSSSERRQGQKHSASNDSVVPLAFKSGCTGGPGSSPPFQTRPPKSPVPVSAPLPVMPTSLQMTHMGIDLLTPGRGPTETQQKEQQQQSYVNVVLGSSGQNLGVLHAGMAPTSQAAYMFAQPGGMLAPLSPLMLSQGTTSTASMLGASHPQHAQQAFGNGLGAHRLNYLGVQHAPKSSAEHVLAHLTQELQQALQLHSHEEPPISKDPHTNSNPHQAAQGLQGATADGASMFFSASQDPFGQDSDSASLFGGYSTSLPVTRAVSVDSDGSMGFSPCAFESPHSALQLPTSDGYWTPFSTPLQDISRAASRVSSLDGGSRGTSVDLNQPQWPQDGLLRTHGSAAGEPLVDSNVGSGDWEAPGTMPSLAQWQLFTSPKGAGASSDGDGLPVKVRLRVK